MDIRQVRKAAGLTQIELASETGISRMRVSLAECGYVDLTPKEELLVKQAAVMAHAKRAAILDQLDREQRTAVGA